MPIGLEEVARWEPIWGSLPDPKPAIGHRREIRTAKKRAVVAVARKLSVLLHHLWVTGEKYEPLYNSQEYLEGVA